MESKGRCAANDADELSSGLQIKSGVFINFADNKGRNHFTATAVRNFYYTRERFESL